MSMNTDFISASIGLVLTLMIFSYLIGDGPLFRIAIYVFIGVASGYAAAVVMRQVIVPKFSAFPTGSFYQQIVFGIIPVLLGASVLAKFFPRTAWIGSFAIAILVGVGAATAIGGALIGSLIPQFNAGIGVFNFRSVSSDKALYALLEGSIMLAGTVFTLAAFHFSAGRAADGTPKRLPLIEWLAWVGRVFIAITLGALFAGVYMASLTAMIERLSSNINFIRQLFGI